MGRFANGPAGRSVSVEAKFTSLRADRYAGQFRTSPM